MSTKGDDKQEIQDKPIDLESARDSISLVMDNYYKAYNSKDLETYSTLLADDGLFCETDPGEFWNKNEVVDLVNNNLLILLLIGHFHLRNRKSRLLQMVSRL